MKEVFKDLWALAQNITLEGGQALVDKYKESKYFPLVFNAVMGLMQYGVQEEERAAIEEKAKTAKEVAA